MHKDIQTALHQVSQLMLRSLVQRRGSHVSNALLGSAMCSKGQAPQSLQVDAGGSDWGF